MLNYLRDLVKNTGNLDVQIIKITGDSDGKVNIEGMDEGKTIVVKGKFLKDIPEFEGTFGLSNLGDLSGYLNICQGPSAKMEIVRENRTFSTVAKDDDGQPILDGDGNPTHEDVTENVIAKFDFKVGAKKMVNPYRTVDKRMIPDQYNFLGANWDIEFEPSQTSIDDLTKQASIGFTETFGVKTEDGDLYVVLGDPEDPASFVFAEDVDGEMKNSWLWDLGKVLNILKLSSNAECTMSFLDKGVLQITLNTGLAEYNYILPAKAR